MLEVLHSPQGLSPQFLGGCSACIRNPFPSGEFWGLPLVLSPVTLACSPCPVACQQFFECKSKQPTELPARPWSPEPPPQPPVTSLEFHPRLSESSLNNLLGCYHKPTPGAVGSMQGKEAAARMTSRAGPSTGAGIPFPGAGGSHSFLLTGLPMASEAQCKRDKGSILR